MAALGPYTISEDIARFIEEIDDPFVRQLQESVKTFSSVTMRDMTTKRFALLFISDENFEKLGIKLATPEKINRLTVSRVVRMTEA